MSFNLFRLVLTIEKRIVETRLRCPKVKTAFGSLLAGRLSSEMYIVITDTDIANRPFTLFLRMIARIRGEHERSLSQVRSTS